MTTGTEWREQVGKVWAGNAAITDRAFSGLTQTLLERLARAEGDCIVDIGCGAGELTLALARSRPAARVTGLDISPDLVEAARQRGANLANARFVLGDAACWQSDDAVDLFVSRHGVMFFDDPVAAFASLLAQTSPSAELVFTCFRDARLNPWATKPLEILGAEAPSDPTAPGPFAFAEEERIRSILMKAGWRDITVEPVDFAFITGMSEDPVADSLEFFTRIGPSARLLRDMDEAARAEGVSNIKRWIERHGDRTLVAFPAAAWMVGAHRR